VSNNDGDCALVLPAVLSAELLDPFVTHPLSRVAGINVLLKYCSFFLPANVNSCPRKLSLLL
jgi:hypothetical protein